MNMKNRKGFTLVEMLVVIAVIGIISTVALTALGPARNKAKDTRIISGLNQVRALAETLYSAGSYAAVTVVQADIAKSATDITANGGQLAITLSADNSAYAAYSRLASNNAHYYCVDSVGTTREVVGVPANGICPAN